MPLNQLMHVFGKIIRKKITLVCGPGPIHLRSIKSHLMSHKVYNYYRLEKETTVLHLLSSVKSKYHYVYESSLVRY